MACTLIPRREGVSWGKGILIRFIIQLRKKKRKRVCVRREMSLFFYQRCSGINTVHTPAFTIIVLALEQPLRFSRTFLYLSSNFLHLGNMDDYTKRLVLCFSEKLDQAKVGYIEWNSFKLMAMVWYTGASWTFSM